MHLSSVRTGSVSQDWRSPLSSEKSTTYLATLRQLENSYTMFSVNLDEALGLRRSGHLAKAYQVLSVTPALCERFSNSLSSLLRPMLEHAKHFGISPNLSPLDPENFQIPKCRRAASFNSICSRILLSQRSQFLNKISTILDLVEDLSRAFSHAANELLEQSCSLPERDWETLDASHYDLNTCFRESIVLLKCFLLALPEAQLEEFRAALQEQTSISISPVFVPRRHLAHRRIPLLKGQ
jgi:hypothetical protein